MKFESVLNSQLPDAVKILERVKALTNECGKLLASALKKDENNQVCRTALHFTRLNYEAVDCIFMCLKAGHLAEVYVLLRWLLEICHLFYYLSKNCAKFIKWLSGEEIKPKTIGQYFENEGLASWKKSYAEWSNVTHANSVFVEKSFLTSRMNPENDGQILLLSRTLRNLMYTAHKINTTSANILKESISVEKYNVIAKEYMALEDQILAFSDEHNKREAMRMKELNDESNSAR